MKHIPNLLTLANAICGMMAIYFIVNSSSTGLVIALLSAATFDALDGWAARKVAASSALGKQLDSLADAISFGAVSGFIWSSILADYARMPQPWAMLLGATVTASSIYRLGIFNLKEEGDKDFTGMPTPANALFANSTVELMDYLSSPNVNVNTFRLWSQHWTQSTYTDESNFQLINRNINGEVMERMYARVLRDIKESRGFIAENTASSLSPTTSIPNSSP